MPEQVTASVGEPTPIPESEQPKPQSGEDCRKHVESIIKRLRLRADDERHGDGYLDVDAAAALEKMLEAHQPSTPGAVRWFRSARVNDNQRWRLDTDGTVTWFKDCGEKNKGISALKPLDLFTSGSLIECPDPTTPTQPAKAEPRGEDWRSKCRLERNAALDDVWWRVTYHSGDGSMIGLTTRGRWHNSGCAPRESFGFDSEELARYALAKAPPPPDLQPKGEQAKPESVKPEAGEDIVDRLRKEAVTLPFNDRARPLLGEAADTITTLRARIAELEGARP